MHVLRPRWVPTLPVFLIGLLVAATAFANPISVGPGALGSATSINFSGFVNGTLVTTQFSGQGLTTVGGLYEDFAGPSSVEFGAPALDNFLPTNPGPGPYNVIYLTFSTPMVVVGMNEISNPGSFNIIDVNGYEEYSSSLTSGFVGFYDPAGFTTVVLTVTGATNTAFGIDSLLFSSTATVPEPDSASMLACAMVILVSTKLFSRRRAS